MQVSIFDCTTQKLPLLKQAIQKNYRDGYILLDDDYFLWNFKNTPAHNKDFYTFKCIEYNNEIIGFIGYQPLEIKNGDTTVIGCTVCNLMVEEKYRGLGLGPQLLTSLAQDFPICLINGFNPDTEYLYKIIPGWQVIGDLTRFVSVLNKEKVRTIVKNDLLDQAPTLPSLREALPLEILNDFGPEFDELWHDCRRGYTFAVERTSAYLNWRYTNHPKFQYTKLALFIEGTLQGYVVARIEIARGVQIFRLIELLARTGQTGVLATAILAYAQNQNMHLVDFFVSAFPEEKQLLLQGFTKEQRLVYTIPMLFSPLDFESQYIRCSGYAHPNVVEASLFSAQNWLITRGDGDRDRPN